MFSNVLNCLKSSATLSRKPANEARKTDNITEIATRDKRRANTTKNNTEALGRLARKLIAETTTRPKIGERRVVEFSASG